MHLITILTFSLLFFQAEQPGRFALVSENDRLITLLIVWIQPLILGIAAWALARYARKRLRDHPQSITSVHHFHHVVTLWLRVALLLGFAAGLFLTRWPVWFTFEKVSPFLQIVGDIIVLSPFVIAVLVMWLAEYPLECDMRQQSHDWDAELNDTQTPTWGLWSYLDFQVRHHLLVVAIPLLVILFCANLTRGFERELRELTGLLWMPDLLLGASALGVFTMAPTILTKVWRTSPLPEGALRDRLDSLCDRINLRCRDILIWKTDGLMINAAVMGLWAPVRYVLLSDALLSSMSPEQVEAVFGHEAGHVHHRHIPNFLIFALVGWLTVSALMELLAQLAISGMWPLSSFTVQLVGVIVTIAYWAIGFGWVSRRFERQADLFGARCVAPQSRSGCVTPCSVHLDKPSEMTGESAVCATGAAIFASALDRVAVLNGIPHEERSWRHSSIGSRIRFLTSLANDPGRAMRFERLVERIKSVMLTMAVIGASGWLFYITTADPVIWKM